MDLISIISLAVLVIGFASIIMLTFWLAKRSYGPMSRRTVVRERIRREV